MENNQKNTKFIVKTAAACMPSSCWGRYGKVAVLEIDADLDDVAMISERARGVHRVVRLWDRLYRGTTEKCAFERHWAQACELAKELNQAR